MLNPVFNLIGRRSQVGQTAYRSRQSLSSPSPGGTEMDLLVMRERPRRGIRNSGYDVSKKLSPNNLFSQSHAVQLFEIVERTVVGYRLHYTV